jgi:hypothetical protein
MQQIAEWLKELGMCETPSVLLMLAATEDVFGSVGTAWKSRPDL